MRLSLDDLDAPHVSRQFITTKSGKRREIFVPNGAMRKVHKRLLEELKKHSSNPWPRRDDPCRRSPVANAAAHAGNGYVYKVDLYNAFPSVRIDWLEDVLSELSPSLWEGSGSLNRFLLDHVVHPNGNGLMVGMPSSRALFERVAAERLDRTLVPYARASGLTYTRYLDDLVFSSWSPIGSRKSARIRKAIKESGFRINFSKTGMHDVTQRPVIVTGIRLGIVTPPQEHVHWADFAGTSMFIPNKLLSRLEGMIHAYSRGADISVSQIEGTMGVLREFHRYEFPVYPALLRVWRAYLEVRPILRPKASLDGADEFWYRVVNSPLPDMYTFALFRSQ